MAKEVKEKEDREKQPRSKNKVFLLLLPALVLLVAAGGAGYYFFGGNIASGLSEPGQVNSPEKKKELGPLLEMEDFVVNITHKDSTRFLKMGVTLEAQSKESSSELEKRIPQIRDAVLLLVGNRKYDDIKDIQGKKQLKADLLARLREVAGEEQIAELYFTDFVVQ